MFEMSASSVVGAVVDKLLTPKQRVTSYTLGLPTEHRENFGLLFKLDISLGVYKTDDLEQETKYYSRRTNVYIAVCGNVSTWVAIQKEDERWFGLTRIPPERWINTGNHDSCWRSDGLDRPLTELYFQFADEINKELEADGHETMALKDMQHYVFCLGDLWEQVLIRHHRDPNDKNGYRRVIHTIQHQSW